MPPRKRRNKQQPADAPTNEAPNVVRGFWSGNLSFGLVSLPVSLVTAQRSGRVALKMLAPDGTPLKRRFVCPKDERVLNDDEIVRGYEVEKDRFVVVTDDELAAIAPKLTQEIDLRRFVPLADIDPMHFEHGYFLVPGKGSGKAYRLLAHIMEERRRAGIATFVMRGKEYLVAIIARGGVLRAETLRFADELRAVTGIGLDKTPKIDADAARKFAQRIKKLRADTLATDELTDRYTERVRSLIDQKARSGKDVIHAPERDEEEDRSRVEVVDLMQYLKASLAAKAAPPAAAARTGERKTPRAATRSKPKARAKSDR